MVKWSGGVAIQGSKGVEFGISSQKFGSKTEEVGW